MPKAKKAPEPKESTDVFIWFRSVKLLQFSIKHLDGSNIKVGEIRYDISPSVMLSPEEEVVGIRLKVVVGAGEADSLDEYASIETETTFGVQGMKELPLREDKIRVPDQLLATLAGLALSTTRGMLLTRGASTYLERLILPIVSPMDLVAELRKRGSSDPEDTER